ncbi:MAG: radical SAM protein [Candidatus Omnitrophota bacterium]
MSEVVLVYPKTGLDLKNVFTKLPLSVLALAPFLLVKGFAVKIIDQRINSRWKEELRESLKRQPVCLGVSVMSGPQITYGLEISKIAKDLAPEIPVVWGGPHPTILPEQTLENPLIDIVVTSEGEESFSELVAALAAQKDLGEVKGIYYKKNAKAYFTGNRDFLDINTLPNLPYDLVDVNAYILTHVLGKRNLMVVPDRGCPRRCSFCSVPHFYRNKVRLATPDKLIGLIKSVKKLGVDIIDIGSEDFFSSKERTADFCNLLIAEKLNVELRAECRVDFIAQAEEGFLELMKRAGFLALQIGAESGSDKILKLLNKGITVDQTLRANERLKAVGIAGLYSFMIGFPGETMEEVSQTVKLAIQLAESNPLARTYNLQTYKPFPGTDLYATSVKNGFHPPQSLEEWAGILDIEYAWFAPRERKWLKKLDLFSYFFDEKGIGEFLNSRALKRILPPYARLVKYRCRNARYNLLFEYPLLQLAKRYL